MENSNFFPPERSPFVYAQNKATGSFGAGTFLACPVKGRPIFYLRGKAPTGMQACELAQAWLADAVETCPDGSFRPALDLGNSTRAKSRHDATFGTRTFPTEQEALTFVLEVLANFNDAARGLAPAREPARAPARDAEAPQMPPTPVPIMAKPVAYEASLLGEPDDERLSELARTDDDMLVDDGNWLLQQDPAFLIDVLVGLGVEPPQVTLMQRNAWLEAQNASLAARNAILEAALSSFEGSQALAQALEMLR